LTLSAYFFSSPGRTIFALKYLGDFGLASLFLILRAPMNVFPSERMEGIWFSSFEETAY
jgi:hypothetical protein